MPSGFPLRKQFETINAWVLPQAISDPALLNGIMCKTSSALRDWYRFSGSPYTGNFGTGRTRNSDLTCRYLHFKGQAIKHLSLRLQNQNMVVSAAMVFTTITLLAEVRLDLKFPT